MSTERDIPGVNIRLYPVLTTEDNSHTRMGHTKQNGGDGTNYKPQSNGEGSPMVEAHTSKQPPKRSDSLSSLQRMSSAVGADIRRFGQAVENQFMAAPAVQNFAAFSVFFTLLSIISYFVNIASDVAVAYFLYIEQDTTWWFWITVGFTSIPVVIINAFSLYRYWKDEPEKVQQLQKTKMSKCAKGWRVFFHCIGFGPVVRYCDILYYGIKSRSTNTDRSNIHGAYCPRPQKNGEPNYYELLLRETRDSAAFDLMASFTQDAPMFALQLYILAVRPPETKTEEQVVQAITMQGLKAAVSIITLSWSLVSYNRAIRFAEEERPNLSTAGCIFQFFWRLFVVASRIVALVLFATVFREEAALLVGAHWMIMFAWLMCQRTNFCGNGEQRRVVAEIFYDLVIGWIYIFCFIDVKQRPTRLKYPLYYIITFAEDASMMVLWYIWILDSYVQPWYHFPAMLGVFSSFFMGMLFMIVYYRYFHPDGRMPDRTQTASFC